MLTRDFHSSVAAILLKMSYGYTVERDKKDPLLTLIDNAAEEFYIATSPGAWLVDTFPICSSLLLFLRESLGSNRSLQCAMFQRGFPAQDSRT